MYRALKNFLAVHHHLALPGIGNFSVEKKHAYIDIANRTVEPPSYNINFSNESIAPNRTFFHFLADELNTDEVQAIRQFTEFTTQLQLDIKDEKAVVLKGFGVLQKQSVNELYFQPDEMPDYFPVLNAERVIRKNAPHTVRVGEDEKTSHEMQAVLQEETVTQQQDRWWIPAIVLAVIGIAALIYYYNVLHHHF